MSGPAGPDGDGRVGRDGTRARRVLLTNDDGWGAPGLEALARVISEFADVVVVAPRVEQSGVGHAITLRDPLNVETSSMEHAVAAFIVDGTPADCAKLGIRALCTDEAPDLVVSGLNNGPNVGVNVLYSGTVGAALEAVINGVGAVAVSKERGLEMSYEDAAELAAPIIRRALEHGLERWRALNINVPALRPSDIAGVTLTRHGLSGFDESYREVAAGDGPHRRFELEGVMTLRDTDGRTAAEALRDGFVAVTPLGLDLSARRSPPAEFDVWSWVLGD